MDEHEPTETPAPRAQAQTRTQEVPAKRRFVRREMEERVVEHALPPRTRTPAAWWNRRMS